MSALTAEELPVATPNTGSTDPADTTDVGESVREQLAGSGHDHPGLLPEGGTSVSMSTNGRRSQY